MYEWFQDVGWRKAVTDLPHLTVSRSAFSSWVLPRVCACLLWTSGLILPFYQDQLQGLLLQHWAHWPGHLAASPVAYKYIFKKEIKKKNSLMTNNIKNNPPAAWLLFHLREAINPHTEKTTTNLATIKSAGISIVGIQTKIKRNPLLKILLYSKVFQCTLLKVTTLSHTPQFYEYGSLPPSPRILKVRTLTFSFLIFLFFLSLIILCLFLAEFKPYIWNTWWKNRKTNLRECALCKK